MGNHMTRGRQEIENSSNSKPGFRGLFRVPVEPSWTHMSVGEYKQLTKIDPHIKLPISFQVVT
jgi:hypothetical protein